MAAGGDKAALAFWQHVACSMRHHSQRRPTSVRDKAQRTSALCQLALTGCNSVRVRARCTSSRIQAGSRLYVDDQTLLKTSSFLALLGADVETLTHRVLNGANHSTPATPCAPAPHAKLTRAARSHVALTFVCAEQSVSWERVAAVGDAPAPRSGHSFVKVGSRFLLFGGAGCADGAPVCSKLRQSTCVVIVVFGCCV